MPIEIVAVKRRPQKYRSLDEWRRDAPDMGLVSDGVIARRLGVTRESVKNARDNLGIAAYAGKSKTGVPGKPLPTYETHVTLARLILFECPVTNATVPADQLALLVLLDHGPLTIREVAASLGVAQSTASNLVSRAVAAGLVERERETLIQQGDTQPRRFTFLRLSQRGIDVRRARRGDKE